MAGVGQLCQLGPAVEVHVAGVGVDPVAHAAPLVLHAKVLHFMALALEVVAKFEYVGFAATVGVEELPLLRISSVKYNMSV